MPTLRPYHPDKYWPPSLPRYERTAREYRWLARRIRNAYRRQAIASLREYRRRNTAPSIAYTVEVLRAIDRVDQQEHWRIWLDPSRADAAVLRATTVLEGAR